MIGTGRFGGWRLISAIVLLLLLTSGWMLRTPLLSAAGAALVEDDGLSRMQAAVVLGGDQDCSRILKAASLVQAGYAPFALVSGPEAFGVHECDLTAQYAEHVGYPASLFRLYPNNFTSTMEEAKGIGKYLRAQGISRVLLVTSSYHTRRAARLFRRENPAMEVRVVPAPNRSFTPEGWWSNREGRKIFLLEWTKTAAAWLRS